MNPTGANQQLTVSIVTNQQAAQQTNQALQQHDASIRQLLRSYRDAEMAARKLTAVGRDFAIAGAAILAPLIASANEYSKRYGQLETQSRNFLAAQQKQADATANLGRVAAQALTPIMNQAAEFTDKVAAFAAAHPELLQAAIGLGGGLAAGGAALVAAGMAISTVAKSAELLKAALATTGTSGLAGAIGTATTSVLALAVGAEIGKAAINAYGKSVDDQRLANYQLTDALTTYRQGLATVALVFYKTVGDIGGKLADTWASLSKTFLDFGTKIESVADRLATDFRELFIKLQGFFGDLYNQTIGKVNGTTISGSENTLAATNTEELAYQQRQSARDEANKYGRTDIDAANNAIHSAIDAALKLLADNFAKFGQTGSLGGGLDGFFNNLGKGIGSFLGGTPPASGVNNSGLPPEAVNAYIDFRKAELQADQQYVADAQALLNNFNAANLKAQEDYQAQQERQSVKALQAFNFNEKQIDEKAQLDRLIALQQHNQKLTELSGTRDVEGFINEQTNFQQQTDAQDKQDALAKKQRLDQFNEQQKEQKQEADDAFKQAQADRATAYQQQLTQLKQKHIQEDNLLEQHFAEQLAALSQNVGGLNGIQSAYYAQMTTEAQNFVNTNKAILQELYRSTLTGASGTLPSASETGGSGSPLPPVTGTAAGQRSLSSSFYGVPSFASGIDRIPRDMLVWAHEGERISRAVDNRPNSTIYHINVNNMVGDLATKSMLDGAVQQIAVGIQRAVYAQ